MASFNIKKTALNGSSIRVAIIAESGAGKALTPFSAIPGINQVAQFLGIKNTIGVEEISYNLPKANRAPCRGASPVITQYTPAIFDAPSLTLKLWLSEYMSWLDQFGGSYINMCNASFNVTLEYRLQDGFTPLTKIEFLNCYINEPSSTVSTSQVENITVDVSCYVTDIKINGNTMAADIIANVLGAASIISSLV